MPPALARVLSVDTANESSGSKRIHDVRRLDYARVKIPVGNHLPFQSVWLQEQTIQLPDLSSLLSPSLSDSRAVLRGPIRAQR